MKEDSLKQKTKKGLLWSFFNQFSNNGLTFVVGVVMARLLSPSDYGITALPAVFTTIANVLVDSGFGSALVRKPEMTEKDLSTSFYYGLVLGVCCYIILFFSSPFIAEYFDTPVLTTLIRVTSLSFLWGPLGTPQGIIMQRRLDFKTPARIAIINNIVGAIIGISLAYMGYGLWSLAFMGISSSLLNTIQRWFAVRWLPREPFSKDSFKYLWNFGNKMMVSTLLDTAYNNITPFFIGKYFSTAELGIYNRAKVYATLPAQQSTSVIQGVTFPVLSKMQNDDDVLARNYRKMLRVTAFIVFPIMLFLSALARPFVILLVTEKWEASIILLQIMCFQMMWYPIHAMNLNLLMVKGRSDLFLRLEVIKKVLSLMVLVISLPFGVVYFVSAGIGTSLLSLIINTHYTGKLINVTFSMQMKDLLPIFILSLVAWLSILSINLFIDGLWAQLCIGGIVGITIYSSAAFLFGFEEISDIRNLVFSK